jgi:hypothetical protein
MAEGNPEGPDGDGDKPASKNQDIIAAINSIETKYGSSQKERTEHDRQVLLWTKRAAKGVFIYTGLTVVIAIASVFATMISRDALISVQRAFVVPAGLKWDPIGDAQIKKVKWNIYATWQNSGNTPTRNLRTLVVKAFSIGILNFDDPLGSNFDIPEDASDKVIPSFLGPKATMDGGPVEIGGEDLARVQQNGVPLVIGGVARYDGILWGDKPHVTKFCFFVTEVRGDPLRLDYLTTASRICKTNNCADDECDTQRRK